MIKFPRAEFFDIFGIPTVTIITILSGWAIVKGEPIPEWGLVFLFIVGILGILVDGTIVSKTFNHKK